MSQAAAGYSNSGLLTVIMLYLVAEGIYQTGGLESALNRLLGRSRSVFWALVRMMIPCMVLSAFLNNTPVVSLLVPILISWARRSGETYMASVRCGCAAGFWLQACSIHPITLIFGCVTPLTRYCGSCQTA